MAGRNKAANAKKQLEKALATAAKQQQREDRKATQEALKAARAAELKAAKEWCKMTETN